MSFANRSILRSTPCEEWTRPSAFRKQQGVGTSSQSGGLAQGMAGCGSGLDAKHTQPTSRKSGLPCRLIAGSADVHIGSGRAFLHHRHGNKLTGHTALARAVEPCPEPIKYRRSQYGMPAMRTMGVASARGSFEARRANILAVGRFGAGDGSRCTRARRQTRPTYALSPLRPAHRPVFHSS